MDQELDSKVLLELMGGIYIQLLRIYDLLALNLGDNPKIDELIALHESGKVLSPAPSLMLDDEDG